MEKLTLNDSVFLSIMAVLKIIDAERDKHRDIKDDAILGALNNIRGKVVGEAYDVFARCPKCYSADVWRCKESRDTENERWMCEDCGAVFKPEELVRGGAEQ